MYLPYRSCLVFSPNYYVAFLGKTLLQYLYTQVYEWVLENLIVTLNEPLLVAYM